LWRDCRKSRSPGVARDLDRCRLRRSSEDTSLDLERVVVASLDLERLLVGASDFERCRDRWSAEDVDDSAAE
jgi:hypothetical protein